jgi:hypothetical protein
VFTPIENMVQQALARLLYQYSNSENFQGLLTAMIGPIQDIENALTDMNNLRYLPQAQGAQLDLIGTIVGLARPPGASDAEYLTLLYVQIKQNTSQGQPEQIIQVFLLLTQTSFVFYTEGNNSEFLVASSYVPPDQATVDSLITSMQAIGPAGVRCDGIIAFDDSIPFAYDGPLFGAGYDDGTQTVGGKYAELFEYLGPGFAYADEPIGHLNNPPLTAPLACSNGQALGYGTLADPLFGGAYLT